MKNLAYIPTKIDKHKIYAEIESQRQSEQHALKATSTEQTPQPNNQKKLNKEDLAQLLQRLTNNTRKQYNTEQQKTHILAVNLVMHPQYQQLRKRREEGEKVQNRLLDYGKRTQQRKVELAKQLEAEKRQKYYREVPEISAKAKNLNQRAIDKRLEQLIQKKQSKREILIQKYQPTFQPEINPQSEFINDLENYGDLHNRMEIREKQAMKRKQSLLKDIQQKIKQEFTFQPNINPNSKNIAEHLPSRKPLSVSTPKTKEAPPQDMNKQIYPFAPTINKNTSQLLNKKGSLEGDCFRRLYNNAKDMLAKHQDKVQQRNRVYTFQPALNSHSIKLANSIQKKPREQIMNDFSDKSEEEYQQIKIGNANNDYSRAKTYSVRNINESSRIWHQNFPQKSPNVLYKSGKSPINMLR